MAKPIYERQTDESIQAYEAFAIYRDLGGSRSLESVAKTLDKSVTLLGRWSKMHDWVFRVHAYDDHIDALARKKIEAEAVKRRADMLRRHALTGKVLQQKGVDYIDKSGIDKSSDAISAIAKGIEIERKAEGLPEHLMAIMEAPDDELYRQYNELLAAIGGIGSGDDTAGTAPAGTDAAETPTETDADSAPT